MKELVIAPSVPVEAGPHVRCSLQTIRGLGKKTGIALDPGTPESAVEHLLDETDLVLVMSVSPGFGGQAFLPGAVDKVVRPSRLRAGRPIRFEVDGGVGARRPRRWPRQEPDPWSPVRLFPKGGAAYPRAAGRWMADAERHIVKCECV